MEIEQVPCPSFGTARALQVAPDDSSSASGYLSPEEMQKWLQQEIADSAKALELRVRQATELVTDYASGKLTPQEAAKRHSEYDLRWGEALPGVISSKNRTDEEILAAIDKAREPDPSEGFTSAHLGRQKTISGPAKRSR